MAAADYLAAGLDRLEEARRGVEQALEYVEGLVALETEPDDDLPELQ